MTGLGWFPPAPAPGPASIVDLPGDDWSMEPKVNGCRVLVSSEGIYTRLGTPLTKDSLRNNFIFSRTGA